MSTQPNISPSWKQEVNQRLAAHKSRKDSTPARDTREAVQSGGSSRAAQAAARVAARYAKAPSYSEMQAAETRIAVRAAEIATQVALDAQATAESALAEMHAATTEQPSRGPAAVETFAPPAARPARRQAQEVQVQTAHAAQSQAEQLSQPCSEKLHELSAAAAQPDLFFTPHLPEGQSFGIRWEPDMPVRSTERKQTPKRRQEEFELSAEDWWTAAEVSESLRGEPIQIVEPEPAHANLIEFPRELVATRKMRPRMAEAACGTVGESEGQLSIFEVDPRSVSNVADSPASMEEFHAPEWTRPDWSGIELGAHPVRDSSPARDGSQAANGLFLAPLGLRLMATVVDGALIAGTFVATVFLAVTRMQHLPVAKAAEVIAVIALVLTGLLYHAFFSTLAISTPGMKYAGVGLCTFDNESPTRAQLRRRLFSMVLSLLPVGLGIVWAVFDDDHLSWHDRISQTYLRKR